MSHIALQYLMPALAIGATLGLGFFLWSESNERFARIRARERLLDEAEKDFAKRTRARGAEDADLTPVEVPVRLSSPELTPAKQRAPRRDWTPEQLKEWLDSGRHRTGGD